MAVYLNKKIGAQTSQKLIAILMSNGWQFVVTYLAILRLGHIAMPLDPTFKKLEIEAVIKQIPPYLAVSDKHYSLLLDSLGDSLGVFEDIPLGPARLKDGCVLRFDAKDQIASLVFTSGTTGKPKAAPYSHRNHIWNIEQCSKVWQWDSEDSLLISLSLSHWYGLVMGLSGIIYHGNTLYLDDWFDEGKTLETLASGKVTMFTHISTIYFKLLEAKDNYDLSNVRLCISGGSALPPAIWHEFKNRFGQEILECYGSSETGRIASNLLDERIPGSPGRVLEGVDFKLSPSSEVLINSEGVFPGYYQNPQATKAGYDAEGYWRTGDIGELENGRVVLKGRVQERIRRFGYTISPRDIEWALYKNPAVKEVYVMGDQAKGDPDDTLIYFIKSNLSQDEIKLYCKQNLPFAWRPGTIIMMPGGIPRTRNGKPKINVLKELAEDKTDA